ncbi:HTH-type transcriptional regulator CfxR [Lentibacillus sp. JNUCC-1]|uniref:LysR family transcriptional regulator n=1 Tax=Lentibacillus sp. JNUCC-1 TaxID=2654513 RepID=UPI0012E966BC|nr:LysR family transcriptional regulator [Lentibacillus sp. JNUCC-1]MUV38188.1 HTH-type transcriptional regulator CfxR [Lentibacillus sp. JNUCC-1]
MDQHLLVFITVAEKENFSRAAEELHMTQPAVSQYIRTFEENIGTRLLERTNKYVRLNKAGEIVYHHGKEIIGLYEKMQRLVDDMANKASGPLSVGASYTFGEYVLPHIIADLQHHYPGIKPSITIGNTADVAEAVKRHELDIGIVEGHFKQEQHMEKEVFAEDRMVIIASPDHPLAQKNKPIALTELENETWVLREVGSGTREAAESLFKQFGVTPRHMINFSSTQPIKEAVGAGLGISLLSEWAIQREVISGDLLPIDAEGLPVKRQFSVVTASPFRTKALQAFMELLHGNKLLKE